VFDINKLVRPNVLKLTPYSSARDEFKGEASVFLDANENSLGSPLLRWYNRYPDPLQLKVKEKLAAIKLVQPESIFLGNGSDECIDLLYRAFCIPGKSNVVICPPTYGMYEVSANINDVAIRKAPLLDDYQLNLAHIEQLTDEETRIIWLCSPNNPTGNSLSLQDIETVLNNTGALVVVDEAYINFARQKSTIAMLQDYPNLVVMQTLSKAWGLAGLRLGMMFASAEIISIINKIKPPYNIGQHTQELVLQALDEVGQVNDMINVLVDMRNALAEVLAQMQLVKKVHPSDANFLLVQVDEARKVYGYLLERGIVVRDRSKVQLCEDCLRITIGTEQENTKLVDALAEYMDVYFVVEN
jgi:histidinol-phosphate aminotransferase